MIFKGSKQTNKQTKYIYIYIYKHLIILFGINNLQITLIDYIFFIFLTCMLNFTLIKFYLLFNS